MNISSYCKNVLNTVSSVSLSRRVCRRNSSLDHIIKQVSASPRWLSVYLGSTWLLKPPRFSFHVSCAKAQSLLTGYVSLLCNNCMNLGTLAHILCWIRDLVVWKTKLNLTVSGSDWLCCMANITYFSKYWIKDSTIPSSLSRLLWQLVKFNWRILKERFYINAKESRNVLVMCAHSDSPAWRLGQSCWGGPPGAEHALPPAVLRLWCWIARSVASVACGFVCGYHIPVSFNHCVTFDFCVPFFW